MENLVFWICIFAMFLWTLTVIINLFYPNKFKKFVDIDKKYLKIIFSIFGIFLITIMLMQYAYSSRDSKIINPTQITTFYDKEEVIIKYKTKRFEVKDSINYHNIIDSNFYLQEKIMLNIFGDFLFTDYEIIYTK